MPAQQGDTLLDDIAAKVSVDEPSLSTIDGFAKLRIGKTFLRAKRTNHLFLKTRTADTSQI